MPLSNDPKRRLRQLRAMFSTKEISEGISLRDIEKRKRELGIEPDQISFRKSVITPAGSPREEFDRGVVPKEKEVKVTKIPQDLRDAMLPTNFEVIQSGENKGELRRKRRFGVLENPTEAASEAQIEAVRSFKEEPIESAQNLSIHQLISSGKINNMTFKQLSDAQKQQFEVLRATNPTKHRQILGKLHANRSPKPIVELNKQEANDILRERDRQRKDQIIFGLQGQRPDDPKAQEEINRLTDGQRNAAVEELFSFAQAKGKASPVELTPGQVRFILSRVRKQYTREGVRKLQ